jgi:predicted AAA+ superfamily ATPase
MRYLRLLEKADLIQLLYSSTKGISQLNKPEKIYLNNPNQAVALSNQLAIGNARETFFMNQLRMHHTLTAPAKGDFLVNDKYIFKVGGKDKKFKQIQGLNDAFIAADDVEFSSGKKIPLWLFGLSY